VHKPGSRTKAAGGPARRVAGTATAAAGLLSIFSALTPDVAWRQQLLTNVEPGSAIALGHVLAAAAGAGLVGLGWGMLRGKRRAADAAAVVLCLSALLHALKGLDYEESVVALGLAGLLWINRGAFRRGGAPRPGLVAAIFAVGAVAAIFALDLTWLLVSGRPRRCARRSPPPGAASPRASGGCTRASRSRSRSTRCSWRVCSPAPHSCAHSFARRRRRRDIQKHRRAGLRMRGTRRESEHHGCRHRP